jgi:hypothetical protein
VILLFSEPLILCTVIYYAFLTHQRLAWKKVLQRYDVWRLSLASFEMVSNTILQSTSRTAETRSMQLPSSSSTQRSLKEFLSTKFRVRGIVVASFEALLWVVAENGRCPSRGQGWCIEKVQRSAAHSATLSDSQSLRSERISWCKCPFHPRFVLRNIALVHIYSLLKM